MAKLFLSHTSSDKELVRRLANDLREIGHEPWLDEWEIRVGESIPARIEHGISEADFVVIVLSTKSTKSNWVEREWRAKYWDEVQGSRVRLLPVLFEDCEIPKLLQEKKYADFRFNYSVGLVSLTSSIEVFSGGLGHRDTEPEAKQVTTPFSSILHETLEELEERKGSLLLGIPTGFIEFDRFTMGAEKRQFIRFACAAARGEDCIRPKRSAACCVSRADKSSPFSPESSRKDCAMRILCSEAGVAGRNLRRNLLSQKDWTKVVQTTRSIADASLYITDSAYPSIEAIESKVRELGAEERVDVIIIDDLQSVQIAQAGKGDGAQIRQAAKRLRDLAGSVDGSLLLLMSSARLERQEDLELDIEAQNWISQADFAALLKRKEDTAQITVIRNRLGEVGSLELAYLQDVASFRNLGREDQSTFFPKVAGLL